MPVNVVDQPELCDFLVPAIIDRDPVTIAIGTDGAAPIPRMIHIVTVDSGASDLLTLRAVRLFETADIIVHDPHVNAQILTVGRRDAERITRNDSEAAMVSLLAGFAHQGKRVVRLRHDTPSLASRHARESAALSAAGVAFAAVPGVAVTRARVHATTLTAPLRRARPIWYRRLGRDARATVTGHPG